MKLNQHSTQKGTQVPNNTQQLIEEAVERYEKFIIEVADESKLGLYKCNDGLNKNGSVDCGIFQINSIHGVTRKWLNNYKINILIAKQIYDEQGNWSAWYSSYKCHGLN